MRDLVAGLLVEDGCALLGLRHRDRAYYPGVWDVPGGHVEPGESAADALRRELVEELGVLVQGIGAKPWRQLIDERRGFDLKLWRVDRWEGRVVNRAPREHERLGWFTAAEAASLALADAAYLPIILAALTKLA